MFELKRSPEFKKIVPIFAIVFLRKDAAIAQTVQPQPVPQPTVQAIDPVTATGYILAAGLSIFTLLPKIVEKWFGQELDARQSKKQLETLIVKSQADLELEDKQKQLEAARNLSDFYLETARESQKSERGLLMTFVTKELTASEQTRDQLYDLIANQAKIISRLELIEESIQKNTVIQKDIMNVLNMKDRNGN
jgi:hypothetical protein